MPFFAADGVVTAEKLTLIHWNRRQAGGLQEEELCSGFQVPCRFPIRRCLRGLLVSPQSIFRSSPLMGCFLFGLPLGVISIMCYGICTADADGGYIEERYEVSKSEPDDGPESEESQEPPQPRGGASPLPAPQGPKDVLEKKKD